MTAQNPSAGLVSCICPTYNRRAWILRSMECFLAQDYAERELVIVDDGTDPIVDLIPKGHPLISYHRLDRRLSIGAKRNLACEIARGEIIAHWDDDDWYPSWRLTRQASVLEEIHVKVCGSSELYYVNQSVTKAFRYAYTSNRKWVAGNTLAYHKAVWREHRFLDIQIGEDSRFVWAVPPESIRDLKEPELCVASIHSNNTSQKIPTGGWWTEFSFPRLEQLMDGVDLPATPTGKDTLRETSMPQTKENGAPYCGFRIARADDLRLPEFAAFNHGQSLPHMRQWELPWALFAAELGNTTSVFDCTINPVNVGARICTLYPYVQYRHFNPVHEGRFRLPFGFPDESFDRVFCINTLEHLDREQRELLLADLSRKLKPGGLLLLTSDYYFDSSWNNASFLNAGVMRADRSEFLGGWNKITIQQWMSSCQRNGLIPVGPEPPEGPQEGDPGLFCNPAPFSHATIAGVFSKGEMTATRKKRILLGLLTWNTRAISMESVHAYLREAHMLSRIGCEPLLCVCDNGSTDGTQDALRALEPQIDIPHSFILNDKNLGNSVARNQIIDYMLRSQADYLLFMDGDIEIVPFSSFAMFRYMENCGRALGCIGADSAGQSPLRDRATPSLFSAEGLRKEEVDLVAWTQYGMFRRAVFEQGVRFDETVPFNGPGWGFEDNDLAFQLVSKGFRNQRFVGMVYLHRAARSSVKIMRELGFDPMALYDKRKKYVIDKWSCVPAINNGPLSLVRRVQMQL